MASLCKLFCLCNLILLARPTFSLQSYDNTNCNKLEQVPASGYRCNAKKSSCDTFIVYRAQEGYQALSPIASLFNTTLAQLHPFNNISTPNFNHLKLGQDIIIPVRCSCLDNYYNAVLLYNASHSGAFDTVACGIYEGLVKAVVLREKNPGFDPKDPSSSMLQVPIKCACPHASDRENRIKYLVTYPVIKDDNTGSIAKKFGVRETMILYANRLESLTAIFPQTTLLIPTENAPVLINSIPEDPPPSPQPVTLDVLPSENSSSKNRSTLFLVGILSGASGLVVLACGVLVFSWRMNHPRNFEPLSDRNSRLSNFSPDLLDGMSKLKNSLVSFSLEELRAATGDFSQGSVIGVGVYRGRIGGAYVAIEQMSSKEAANHVIGILTKINHVNVVKLEGCCYGAAPYLVYEFVENGSLRDCLSNPKKARQLKWGRRMQIAFDLAVGLHYLHYCTKPAYVHRNINSKNVLVTMDWRAKIFGFRSAKAVTSSWEKEEPKWNECVTSGREGYLAPEHVSYRQASSKVDVYAFGVVLLELLSGKEATADGNLVKDVRGLLEDGAVKDSGECLEKLKRLMDAAALEGEYEYPLVDAMCLALLTSACLDEDPLHRPTMNDVFKALSRFI
ncbi:lysM domain receptor-like kinase 4 [Diospyros lotus]|uniref:lysM domain receptor-like kinase 4 n=1 Tax=Diospyros lotus TaxID=55363 RepID=UPI002251769D|nr:lysM domain receptor-like kinase 4 [Diospyros lotus]